MDFGWQTSVYYIVNIIVKVMETMLGHYKPNSIGTSLKNLASIPVSKWDQSIEKVLIFEFYEIHVFRV